jgi:hypothetical protein
MFERPKIPEDYFQLSKIAMQKLQTVNVIIWGAFGIGNLIFKHLKENRINIVCYCDNNLEFSKVVNNVPVLSIEECLEKYPDAVYILSARELTSIKKMEEQLKSLCSSPEYIYYDIIYFHYILFHRDVVPLKLANALFAFFEGARNSLLINSLSFRITSKCSLRCKNCSFHIPYHKNYFDFDFNELMFSLRKFCDLTDAVLEITVNGGETLLYTDLIELLEEISKINNIILITVVTNGTIIPSDSLCEVMNKLGVILRISDYGEYSNNICQVKEKCQKYSVPYFKYHRANVWFELGRTKHNRSMEMNKKIQELCPFNCGENRRILGIFNNEVHVCDRIDGVLSENINADVVGFQLTENVTKNELQDFLNHGEHYKACDYCNYPFTEIPAGEQEE